MFKVLAIDDVREYLLLISAYLKNLFPGVKVVTAQTGENGIQIAQKEKPDVILLDISMPGMDGYETCRIIKDHDITDSIPVIMVTGFSADADCGQKAIECGADALLAKPIKEAELLSQVNAVMKMRDEEERLKKEKETYKKIAVSAARELRDVKVEHEKKRDIIRLFAEIVDNMQAGLHVYHLENIDDDKTLRMIAINDAAAGIVGLDETELVGKTLDENFPGLREKGIPQNYAQVVRTGTSYSFEDILYGDDRVPQAHFAGHAIPLPNNHVGVLFQDITKRKRAENEQQKACREKELLLRDIHHRIKNNLTIVSSLLNMQSSCLDDPAAKEAFAESRKRIQAISMIHEKLYLGDDLAHIDFHRHTHDLLDMVIDSFPIKRNAINLDLDIQDLRFTSEIAIPLGLILTELLTNALKYGRRDNETLTITIRLKHENNQVYLTISDTGPGLPENMNWKNTDTLGLQLVHMLTGQLEGTAEMNRQNGTHFHISFPYPHEEGRETRDEKELI